MQFLHSSIDFEKLLNKYPNVTREELEKLRDTNCDLKYFEYSVSRLSDRKKNKMILGKLHTEAGSLIQILSVCISPHQVEVNKPLAIYGRIYVECHHFYTGKTHIHDLFNRGCRDPEILSPSGNLTLTSPDMHADPGNMCIPLQDTKIVVDVWDATQNVVIAQDSFFAEDATKEGVYEKVNLKIVGGPIGSVFVRYVAMPLSASCFLEVGFFKRKIDLDKVNIDDVLNVYGKVVARYGNTYGNYADEECTLFEKQSYEFEQVNLHPEQQNCLRMSRFGVSFPAYSSLIIDVELFDFDTKRLIFKGAVQGSPDQYESCYEPFALDNYVFFVTMIWFPRWPAPCRLLKAMKKLHKLPESSIPLWRAARATEVFSIFIGRQKMIKTLKIFGSIEVHCGSLSFDIFRRDEDDAFELAEDHNFLPILDSSRYNDCYSVIEIKVDLKDVDGNLSIKGLIDGVDNDSYPPRYDTQLCFVIQDLRGFVALQHTIFQRAFQASVEVRCKPKNSGCFSVHGRFVAGYDTYDYSTRFQKDHFRVVLFERNEKDMVSVGIDGKIPLSRSIVMVPADKSRLVIEADLMIMDQFSGVAREVMSHFLDFAVGQDFCSVETEDEDYIIDIFVEWTGS